MLSIWNLRKHLLLKYFSVAYLHKDVDKLPVFFVDDSHQMVYSMSRYCVAGESTHCSFTSGFTFVIFCPKRPYPNIAEGYHDMI